MSQHNCTASVQLAEPLGHIRDAWGGDNRAAGHGYPAAILRRAWRDSNPQPTDSKSGALSIELQAHRWTRPKAVTSRVYHKKEQSQNEQDPQSGCRLGDCRELVREPRQKLRGVVP